MKFILLMVSIVSYASAANATEQCSALRDRLQNFYVGGEVCRSIMVVSIGVNNKGIETVVIECHNGDQWGIIQKNSAMNVKERSGAVRLNCTNKKEVAPGAQLGQRDPNKNKGQSISEGFPTQQ